MTHGQNFSEVSEENAHQYDILHVDGLHNDVLHNDVLQDDVLQDDVLLDGVLRDNLLEDSLHDSLYDYNKNIDVCSTLENDENSTLLPKKTGERKCYVPARFVLAFWSFLGFVNMYTLRMDINVAILDMVYNGNTSASPHLPNSSLHDQMVGHDSQNKKYHWTESQQYTVISAFYYGYCSSQILGGYLSGRTGGKLILGLGLLVTSLLTLATPLAVYHSYYLLVLCRVCQGLAQGLAQPCMHTMWSNWAPESEKSLLMSITYSGCQLGTIIASLTTSYLCQFQVLGGWQSVFYIFGSAGVIWSVHWLLLIHDTPREHPRISQKERDYIEQNINHDVNQKCVQPAWTRVLKSPALHAIFAAHFANDWGCFALTTCLPKYLKSILKYDLTQNGFLSSLPFLVLLIINPLSGCIADTLRKRHILTTKNTRKLVNSIGLFIPSVLMFAVCFLDSSRTTIVALLVLAVGVTGFTMAGYSVNHLDIAPTFAGTLYGMTNTVGTIAGFIGPTILGVLTNDQNTSQQWHIFFYITSGIFFTGGAVFLLFAQGEPQNWTRPTSDCSSSIQETDCTEDRNCTDRENR